VTFNSVDKAIIDVSIRYLKNDLLAIYRAGDAFNCELSKLNTITEADYLIITRSFLRNLSGLISEVKRNLSPEWRYRVNLEVFQRELLSHFYENCIYPVVNGLLNGKMIYGVRDFNEFKSIRFKVSSLSIQYLLCKSLYRFNYIKNSLLMKNIKDVLRHVLYSIKYSLAAIILWEEGIVVNCFRDILNLLSKADEDLSQRVLRWIHNMNKSFKSKYHRKNSIKISIPALFQDFLDLPYYILSYSWKKLNKKELISYRELLELLRRKKPIDIDFLCLDGKPTMVMYIDNHERRVCLVK